jgi:L-ascorbate metabolism protein UlaG (beta-lactamase superfamily)
MKITWFGQACFELAAGGTIIICDPYNPSIGYAAHPRRADVVTVSHEHMDHNHLGWIEGTPVVVRGEGMRTIKGIRITGLESFHDNEGGARRGLNTIFIIDADGVRLCHLGDIGHMPDRELLEQIGKIDVLLIPVGGYYTIDGTQAAKLAAGIGAKLTIPMHYRTGTRESAIETVDAFAHAMNAQRAGSSSIELTSGNSGSRTVILDYLR